MSTLILNRFSDLVVVVVALAVMPDDKHHAVGCSEALEPLIECHAFFIRWLLIKRCAHEYCNRSSWKLLAWMSGPAV